jgi:hypothetical protein
MVIFIAKKAFLHELLSGLIPFFLSIRMSFLDVYQQY